MRLTVYLFAKSGALKAMQMFSIEDINTVSDTVLNLIPDFNTPCAWTEHSEEIIIRDEYGWIKAKVSKKGERCLLIFQKEK